MQFLWIVDKYPPFQMYQIKKRNGFKKTHFYQSAVATSFQSAHLCVSYDGYNRQTQLTG